MLVHTGLKKPTKRKENRLSGPRMDPPKIPYTVSRLITRVRRLYLFAGAAEDTIAIKYFRHSLVITAVLLASPSPRVCIDFRDIHRPTVHACNINIEVLFN